jgi:hypothetical protein
VVKGYINAHDFEEGLNKMKERGYTLHSWAVHMGNYTAVFTRDDLPELR